MASDAKTNEQLWVKKIYDVNYVEGEELDTQDVFFTKIKSHWFSHKLTITNEKGETFEIDLESKDVTQK